jgi:hypothetical protein
LQVFDDAEFFEDCTADPDMLCPHGLLADADSEANQQLIGYILRSAARSPLGRRRGALGRQAPRTAVRDPD